MQKLTGRIGVILLLTLIAAGTGTASAQWTAQARSNILKDSSTAQ